jgi:hypothetical protein
VKQNLYLQGFALGFGRVPESSVSRLNKSIEKVRKSVGHGLYRMFEQVLPAEHIKLRDGERKRLYDSRATFWGMLSQTFRSSSLRDGVRELQAIDRLLGRPVRSENTGPYCKARQRLDLETVEDVHHGLYEQLERGGPDGRGRVLSVDATGVRLDDTAANRDTYGYAPGQKDGCGFPVMQLVTLMDLDCGAVVDAVDSPNRDGESPLFDAGLMQYVRANDILVADRAYCSYYNLTRLEQTGAFALMRLHGTRDTKPLKHCDDTVVTWKRPPWNRAPTHLFPEQWEKVPGEMKVRLVRIRIQCDGFRPKQILLATTLFDMPLEELAALYRRRWEIETGFGDIKTTLGMDHVSVKSPDMALKQVYLFLIANNLIRWLVLQAGQPEDRISFKGTIDCLNRWSAEMANLNKKNFSELFAEMLRIIGADKVPHRPNRSEPRCVKARPKRFQRLTRPRHTYKEFVKPRKSSLR